MQKQVCSKLKHKAYWLVRPSTPRYCLLSLASLHSSITRGPTCQQQKMGKMHRVKASVSVTYSHVQGGLLAQTSISINHKRYDNNMLSIQHLVLIIYVHTPTTSTNISGLLSTVSLLLGGTSEIYSFPFIRLVNSNT